MDVAMRWRATGWQMTLVTMIAVAVLAAGCGAPAKNGGAAGVVRPAGEMTLIQTAAAGQEAPSGQEEARASARPGLDPAKMPPAARPLAPLFSALRDIETRAATRPVTILHIGDSHTANDRFSGRLRERFQQRFGASGRGMLPPAVPYRGYRPTHVQVQATPDWQIANSFDSSAGGVFGLTGFRVRGTRPDQSMSIQSTEDGGFDQIEVEVLMQPAGGSFGIDVDGTPMGPFETRNDSVQVGMLRLPLGHGRHRVDLRPRGDGPVDLLSWTVERPDRPGIVYDSHGIVGATVNIVSRWDENVVLWEISHRAPTLIVVAFGTNEGFNDTVTREEYAVDFERRLAFLRRAAPNAAIMVVGPPDGNRLSPGCSGAGSTVNKRFPCVARDQVAGGFGGGGGGLPGFGPGVDPGPSGEGDAGEDFNVPDAGSTGKTAKKPSGEGKTAKKPSGGGKAAAKSSSRSSPKVTRGGRSTAASRAAARKAAASSRTKASRQRPGAASFAACRWAVPPNLGVVRGIQKTVSQARGYYFWDWSKVMNGSCGMHEWVKAEPPLAFVDHVHLLTDGYVRSADVLFEEIMSLYDQSTGRTRN